MDNRTNEIRSAWNEWSDGFYERFGTEARIDEIVTNPASAFRDAVLTMLKTHVGEFKQKRILVPASGDNQAVFAFHIMGASVTSFDLSDKQLANAARIADKRGWSIEFIQGDAMELTSIDSAAYDLVYISNGVMHWFDDLGKLYKNVCRVLRPGGHYVMYDRHPFMSPLDDENANGIYIRRSYDDIGPSGRMSVYSWRFKDIINAIAASGLIIKQIDEMSAEYGTYWVDPDKVSSMPKGEVDRLYDMETNPLYALPQCLSICAQRQK